MLDLSVKSIRLIFIMCFGIGFTYSFEGFDQLLSKGFSFLKTYSTAGLQVPQAV
jgi:hypothetical protein